MIGQTIGPYQILAELGRGGMGEVYRARDTKLNRDVAIKVLPEAFALDADRLARFTREAQVLASLNHPNIAAIYGIEEFREKTPDVFSRALVMELVEGRDLSEIIGAAKATPYTNLPLPDALNIARQIADALEAAHEQGIVHRDLKPQNIKVRADGTVKVLDFGLAKAMDPGAAEATPYTAANSPTLTARATQMGMIIGTAAYMAPEQARGKPVDRRADIWAFGVVLYEMLTGRRAFEGEDISVTLANVIKEDPKFDALPAGLPVPIVRLLRRCLEKDPKRRLSSIGDARIEIDDALHPSPDVEGSGQAAPAPPVRSARLPWIVAGMASALLFVALAALWLTREPPASLHEVQFTVPTTGVAATLALQISPDGRMLAFSDRNPSGGPNVIWVRPMGSSAAYPLPGTEGVSGIFWSPDSQSIGFTAAGKLLRVAASGAPLQTIADAVQVPAGAAWTPGGEIVFGTTGGAGGRLYKVSASGGVPVELARPDPARQEIAYLWPSMLPGGRRFFYLVQTSAGGERAVYVGSLDGGAPVRLMASDSMVVFAAPGHLLFTRGTTLFAQSFDAATLTLSGEAVRVADDVQVSLNNGRAAFSVSENGVLAYRGGGGMNSQSVLAWFDRTGKRLGAVGDPADYYQIRLSPDGKRVALLLGGTATQNYRLSVLDLANGVMSAVTDTNTTVNDPAWLPDSQTIGFGAFKAGRQIFTQRIGQANATLAFSSSDEVKWLDDWSADGAFALFHLPKPSKLYAVKLSEPAKPMLLLDTPETVDGAHFSPDGQWIAYQITEGGTYQIWVASFPAFDQRRRISPKGGAQAFWRGDGKELFYLTPEGKMMSAAVTRDSATVGLSFSAPVEMFQSPQTPPTVGVDQYSVTRNGQRFLFVEPVASGAVPPITVTLNWTAGLGR